MTLATTISRTSYPGTGSVGPFAFPFKINVETDLLVTKRSVTAVETTLAWPADFTVTGVLNASGTISLTVALAVGETITIRRKPPLTQAVSLRNQGAYFPSTIEDELDRLVMQLQSLKDAVDRAPKLKESVDPALWSMAGIEPQANAAIAFNAAGTGIEARPLSPTATILPGQGRTVPDLATYLTNNQVFNVLDFAPPGVVINTGINDATSAILTADAAAAVAGGHVFFPSGIYKTSQNLIVSRRWIGVPYDGAGFGTIIRPTAAVTKCIDLRTQGILEGFYLDGVNTSGKTGIDVGTALLVNLMVVRDCQVWNFTGVGGRGIKLAQCVTAKFTNVYCTNNYINLHTSGSGGTPTDTEFDNCQFRSATTKGVWIENGFSIRFNKCLFESNGEEGLYFQNVGDNAAEIGLSDGCWFEANWQSVASGATRHTHYDIFCDGANGPSGTIRFSMRDNKHAEGTTGARAMRLTNCVGYVVDNCKFTNEAAQALVDGTSYGQWPNWPAGNGAFLTTVSANFADPLAAWNGQSVLQDGHGWTAAPALQNGWVNFGGAASNAQYMIDVAGFVHLRGTIKSGTTTPATLLFTLPAGFRPPNQIIYITVSNDVAASISVSSDGTVKINAGVSAVYLSLDGISFRVT